MKNRADIKTKTAVRSAASDRSESKLLYRHDRYDDGSIRLKRPYRKGIRDDREMLKHDCLAFGRDLSKLPPHKKKEFLDFERAYVYFYRLYTGSCVLPKAASAALDLVQRDMEELRRELDEILELDFEIPAYSPKQKIKTGP